MTGVDSKTGTHFAHSAYNATLIAREDLNEELSIIRVAPDTRLTPFQPGQHVTLGIPKDTGEPTRSAELHKRPFSIASSPDDDALEFYVALQEDGQPKLWPHAPAGRLFVGEKPKGTLVLDPVPRNADLVMVSTGTGVAPFVAMYRHFRQQRRWRSFTLLHGARREVDLGFRAELEQAAAADPTLRYVPVVSREPGWRGAIGRVQAVLNERPLPSGCHVFLCGNPAMVADVAASLQKSGFRRHKPGAPGNLHFESY